MMQVPFIFGPSDLRLCDVESPRAGPDDVLVRVGAAGICGSDLGFYALGGVIGPTPKPMPIGHELAGTIAETGANVRGFAIGDRVVLNPLVNMIGNGGPEGGFASLLLVRDVVGRPGSLLRLPPGFSLDEGALIEPLAVAAHAIDQLGAQPGSKVAIFGGGPIGLAATVMLKARGIDDVVVFEPSAFRRERAERLGARATRDPFEHDPATALRELHGEAALFRSHVPATTHYLEASGAPVLPAIVAMARARATICVCSVQKKPVTLDFTAIMTRELRLCGALGYPDDFAQVIDLLQTARPDLEAMISHRFAAADFLDAFAMAGRPDQAAKVVVRYES